MSLQRKIILSFGLFAVVPLMALAAFSYWHAENLLRMSVESQLAETARLIGEDWRESGVRVQSSLGRVAQSLSQGIGEQVEAYPAGVDAPLDVTSILDDPVLSNAAFVQLHDALGLLQDLQGAPPGSDVQCAEDGGSRIVVFSHEVPVGETGLFLRAGFWASDLLTEERSRSDQTFSIVEPGTGRVVFSQRCVGDRPDASEVPQNVLREGSALRTEPEAFRPRVDGERKLGVVWPIEEAGLVVIATGAPSSLIGSLNRLVVSYWLFVLGLGATTALAFSVMLGRYTQSLRDLARAAEEIGLGELDPWLPLPASGEVGQLTLTFSRMLARIRQMMDQIDQSGRLAVVGQLSAYLAHEIRNPLSSIKINLQRLKRWTDRGKMPGFCREPIEISLKEVDRLNGAVSGVLQLSRGQDSPRKVVQLHELVAEATELLENRFRRQGVGLRIDLDAEADRVLARPGQLKSVILNLMVNALEAQPTGGNLEIRTELAREPETGVPVLTLHFKDAGSGVDPEIRDRIFEPFFTTKAGGSGIGLAMAVQAVRENDGDLYLEPGVLDSSGAEFVVAFPLAALGAEEAFDSIPVRPLVNLGNGPPRWGAAKRKTKPGIVHRPGPSHEVLPGTSPEGGPKEPEES
jgi:signal transduction histidine kinase